MGILPWDLGPGFGFSFVEPARTPRLTVRCEYPDESSPPSEVSFRLSPSYGIHTAREAHDWFLSLMRENEEFVPHFGACFLRGLTQRFNAVCWISAGGVFLQYVQPIATAS